MKLVVAMTCALSVAVAAQSPPGAAVPPDTRPSFAEWLGAVKTEALSRGIRQEVIDQALGDVEEPLPVIIERDRAQAEIVLPVETYISRRLTPSLIRTGRDMFSRHRSQFDDVAGKYGVPADIIAAVWGIESNFGRFSGVRPTVSALATLAWDPRRSKFFRGELFNALEILNRGDIELADMRGSWAGAMGQPQFMPSSYLQFAEDFDGDGRRDIWSSGPDVFASIANYLKGHGWKTDVRWGREVSLSPDASRHIVADVARRDGSCQATRDMTVPLPVTEWRRLGVRTMTGAALPASEEPLSLISGATRRFLVGQNYDALLSYNCAHAYALSVALLAERISSKAPVASGGKRTPAPKPPARKNP